MQKYELSVFNPATDCETTVAVSEEVYHAYRRSRWNAQKQDRRYYAHEIQFSSLVGGEDEGYERFREFLCAEDALQEEQALHEALQQALECLSEKDRRLIHAIYSEGATERAYAETLGVCRNAVHKQKTRILAKLKEQIQKTLEDF